MKEYQVYCFNFFYRGDCELDGYSEASFEFNSEVTNLMNQGWVPLGAPKIKTKISSGGGARKRFDCDDHYYLPNEKEYIFLQAMTRTTGKAKTLSERTLEELKELEERESTKVAVNSKGIKTSVVKNSKSSEVRFYFGKHHFKSEYFDNEGNLIRIKETEIGSKSWKITFNVDR